MPLIANLFKEPLPEAKASISYVPALRNKFQGLLAPEPLVLDELYIFPLIIKRPERVKFEVP